MYDIIIIGAGLMGCAVARELSRYRLDICVFEALSDCALKTSKANSGIVHAGYDAKSGTLKGALNAKSNAMFDDLAAELNFPFKRIGALVLCFDEADLPKLEALKQQGIHNGVPGLEILNFEQIRIIEPNISDGVKYALYSPTSGVVSPYEMTIAYAENAAQNGVEFMFDSTVSDITKDAGTFRVTVQMLTTQKPSSKTVVYQSRLVINCAGLCSDSINNLVSDIKINISPRKGQYCLYDKSVGDTVRHTLFQLPTELGKGVLVTPTVEGNLLIGPNAVDLEDKDDLDTTAYGNEEILKKASLSIKQIPYRQVITNFSGLRSHHKDDDFIIGEVSGCEGFINVAGIDSPGVSSAPAIGGMVCEIVKDIIHPQIDDTFNPIRGELIRFRDLDIDSQNVLIGQNPQYGNVVCRCEIVTEAEIVDCIHRPVGATMVDGVKYRTRCGLGRCQAGFCSPKIMEILARERNIDITDVTMSGGGSYILTGKNKD